MTVTIQARPAPADPPPDQGAPPLGRSFVTLWAGQTASLLGTTVSGTGVSIVAFVETGSVWWLSVFFLAAMLPGLALASHAGDLTDRSDRRRVLLGADAIAAVATLAALVLHLTGALELWHLAIVAVVGSVATAYQQPAYQSALPLLVPKRSIDRAQGLLQIGPALGVLAGPAIAGALVATGGIGAVLLLDIATFSIAMVTTAVISIPTPTGTTAARDAAPSDRGNAVEASPPQAPRRGLRATWASLDGRLRGIRHLLLYAGAMNLVLTVVNVLVLALLVPLAGPGGAGLLMSVGGVAMLLTAATVSARGVPPRRVRTIVLGVLVVAGGLVLTGLRPMPALVGIGLATTLAGAALLTASAGTIFQTEVPVERQGRLTSLRRVVAESPVPFAVLAVAPLAEGIAEPMMQPGGLLATSLGAIVGIGPGRGIALLFVVVGVLVGAIGLLMARDRTLRVLDEQPTCADADGG